MGKPNEVSSKTAPTTKRKKLNQKPEVDPKLLLKYTRGPGIENAKRITDIVDKAKILTAEKNIEWAEEQAARAEILLTEDVGYVVSTKYLLMK